MKRIVVFLCLLNGLIAFSQSPKLIVKDSDSLQVKMSQLIIKVKVVGNIAYTTTEMHFFNSGNKQMEAELLFPLPEGVSVSRYAIDINNKMREAVPVNKNKGKQVFEAVEHKRVDPGLLERVEGNNFKTRIYPILPNKERIVIIGYEEELNSLDNHNLTYQFLSSYTSKVAKFDVNITVLGAASVPSINGVALEKSNEVNWNHSYQTAIQKIDYQPLDKFTITIPIQEEIPSVVTQSVNAQHYFYANTYVESEKRIKKSPNSIGLIWDVSLSCKKRDLKKELDFLDHYFKRLQNTKVTLYLLNYNFVKGDTFTIENGNWGNLKTTLENVIYDGGTCFSKIKLPIHDEYLFFTDGISSLSENTIQTNNKPLYTITSLASSDYAFMNYNALKSNGSIINLNILTVEKASDKLMYQNLKFLGIKENYFISDLYPMVGSSALGNFSVSGVSLKEQNEITLLFGYDNNAVLERKIKIDAKNQSSTEVNVEKLWAQKKIANLEIQYNQHAEEIETLGKKYGIVTQNTSLIVLEDINDYIQYDIVPPAELRAEYDAIVKQQRVAKLAEQQNNWENVESYHNAIADWWNKNIKYVKPKPVKVVKPTKANNTRTRNRETPQVTSRGVANGVVTGTVSDSYGPIPGANVIVKGTTRGVSTGFDGKYTISANVGEKLVYSFMGMEEKEITLGNANVYNVRLVDESKQLGEVVVTGFAQTRRQEVSYSSQRVQSNSIEEKEEIPQNEVQSLAGRVSGVQITTSNAVSPATTSVENDTTAVEPNNGFEPIDNVKVQSWNPDRIYLKAIEAAPSDKKYSVYLALRDEQLNNPSFYFDVANYFYNIGDKQKALLVVSTIADLGLENHQLYKSLIYQFRQWGAFEEALYAATQVAKWRVFEPQSHRDLGLTLEDNKHYQAGFDELIKALEVNYFGNMSGHYEGIEDIILMDINRMIMEHPNLKTDKLDKKYLNKKPVDVRIILNWNQMDTDIDLHIIEPTNEECYYGHTSTEIGAKFSKDFTQGYGPEQYLLRNAVKGKFQIKTNFYGESTLTENGPTTVMVEIYTFKNGKTERKLQTIQLGKVKENENLAEITID